MRDYVPRYHPCFVPRPADHPTPILLVGTIRPTSRPPSRSTSRQAKPNPAEMEAKVVTLLRAHGGEMRVTTIAALLHRGVKTIVVSLRPALDGGRLIKDKRPDGQYIVLSPAYQAEIEAALSDGGPCDPDSVFDLDTPGVHHDP